ncbi:Cadherin-related tumor suppressor [Schistosoma japonicum]|nr:Cadherin-related tumor suppressor [Schistosoma japonicum]
MPTIIVINNLLIFQLLCLLIIWVETTLSTNISYSTSTVKLIQSKTISSVNTNPIGNCQPPCLNNGICRRIISVDGKDDSKCICTPDFKGVYCNDETETDLTSCYESTCKYGGMCIGTSKSPKCSCKLHSRGKRCERHDLFFVVELQVYENGKEATWQKDYEDKSSYLSNKTSADVCKLLQLGITQGSDIQLSSSFIQCNLITYHKNPVIIEVQLVLDIELSMVTKISSSVIHNQLITGLKTIDLNLNELKTISLDDIITGNSSTFNVYVLDPCKSGNHDCSTNAKCITQPQGTYMCVCNSFTIDASLDRNYPGRRCLYDGLIILAFAFVGGLICTLTVLICGCRRTIWRRYHYDPESIDLMNMPRNYDI